MHVVVHKCWEPEQQQLSVSERLLLSVVFREERTILWYEKHKFRCPLFT